MKQGCLIWCTHHDEWVMPVDVNEEIGPANTVLCEFLDGRRQAIPLTYLQIDNRVDDKQAIAFIRRKPVRATTEDDYWSSPEGQSRINV